MNENKERKREMKSTSQQNIKKSENWSNHLSIFFFAKNFCKKSNNEESKHNEKTHKERTKQEEEVMR